MKQIRVKQKRVKLKREWAILLIVVLMLSSSPQFISEVHAYGENSEVDNAQELSNQGRESAEISEDISDPIQEDKEVEESQEEKSCNCTELCTEDYSNTECPVCGSKDADISQCREAEDIVAKKGEEGKKICNCIELCSENHINVNCPVCTSAVADCLPNTSADTELFEEVCDDYVISNLAYNMYALEPPIDIEYSTIWDGTAAVFGLEGEGTIDAPYLISCGQELEWFRIDVKNGNNYSGKYVKLSKDIYLNTINADESRENWDDNNCPINIWEGIDGFCGTFDGDGNTIFGLYMKNTSDNTGLFNSVTLKAKTVIKNLNLSHVYVSGTNNVGAIVGNGLWVYILNCSVDGVIKGTGSNIGGFIGKSGSAGWYGTTISDCHNYANVIGQNNVGGFLGYSYIGNSIGAYDPENCNGTETITLTSLINNGDVNGKDYVGGIAGSIGRNLNCGGMVLEKLANNGGISGNNYSGGIFGSVEARYRSSDIIQASIE